MASGIPLASLTVAPSTGYHFTNSAVGDLLIHGLNGGSGQKILVGTQSNQGALMTFAPEDVQVSMASFSMKNASGKVSLTTAGSEMRTTGSFIPASGCNLTIGSDTSRWSRMFINDLTMAGTATFGCNIAMSNATGTANFWAMGSNVGINTVAPAQALDVNGSVAVASNLGVSGGLQVAGVAALNSNLAVNGATTLANTLLVTGASTLSNTLLVTGATTLSNALTVDGPTTLDSTLTVTGASTLSNTVLVYGASTLSNALTVDGATTLDNTLLVTGASTLSNTLLVTGATTLSNTLAVSQPATFASNLTVLGKLNVDVVTYNTSNIIVYSSQELMSNVLVEGILDAQSNLIAHGKTTLLADVDISSNLLVNGATTLSNTIVVTKTALVQGDSTFSSNVLVRGDATILGTATFSNAVYVDSSLTAKGATTLSNTLLVTGATTLSNALTVDGAATLDSTLLVTGASTLSNTVLVYGASTLSNALTVDGPTTLDNTLLVTGASTLSNALTVDGPTTLDSTLLVTGASTLSNTVLVYGASTLSNTLTVDGATTLDSTLLVTGATTISNALAVTQPSTFASNLTVLGELKVETITYNMSNIVIYSSEEIRSNLLVEGVVDVNSNLSVDGRTTLSNAVSIYSAATLYNSNSTLTMSNADGKATLSASGSNFGVNIGAGSNAKYTVDINGDINFSGQIYQKGAVFSGWNSNAFGNYINSNAAFQGPATADDVLLLYMSNALAFSMSNSSGEVSVYTSNNFMGVGTSNPTHALQVVGDVHASDGVYVRSNQTFFESMRADCAVGVVGSTIMRGDAWAGRMYSTGAGTLNAVRLVGNGAGVDSNAISGTLPAIADYKLPIAFNELLTCPTGDVTTSNLLTRGAAMVDGSFSVIGKMTGNDAVLKRVVLSGGHSNFHTDQTGSNTSAVLPAGYPMASSNALLPSVLLEVHGDAAINSCLSLRSNAYMGGTVFVGSNVNASVPAVPNAAVTELSNVFMDVQGDAIVEGGVFAKRNMLVDGRIGVNVHAPSCPVDVQASVSGVSVNCTAKVVASEFVVYSDRRIKTAIVDFDESDLVEKLAVKQFEYVDAQEHPGVKYGFIAQEVEAVSPACVATTSGFVPDVFWKFALSPRNKGEWAFDLSEHPGLDAAADARIVADSMIKCRMRDSGGDVMFVRVVDRAGQIVTVHVPQVDDGTADASIFVIGTRVADLKILRTDQISALAISAIQAQGKKIRALEQGIAAILDRMTTA